MTDATETLNWGIVATGGIAAQFARSLRTSRTGRLVAVGSRTRRRAAAFADEVASGIAAHDYAGVVADPSVEAVYIATPHPQHAEWATAALRAGKAVLCEKPLTPDLAGSEALVAEARRQGAFLMEAFMYRFHPQIELLTRLVAERAVGELRLVRSSFTFRADVPAEHRLRAPELAGGGILDVGGYPVSLARLLAGAAAGGPPADPVEVRALGRRDPTGVDELALALLRFDDGTLAEVGAAIGVDATDTIEVVGTEGRILVPEPCWGVGLRDGGSTEVVVERPGRERERHRVAAPTSHYALEADEVARCRHLVESPRLTHADSLGTLRVLQDWREQLGVA